MNTIDMKSNHEKKKRTRQLRQQEKQQRNQTNKPPKKKIIMYSTLSASVIQSYQSWYGLCSGPTL